MPGAQRNCPARSHFSFITGFSSPGNSAAVYGGQLVRVETLNSPNGNFPLYLATNFLIRFLFAGFLTGISRFRLIQPRKSYLITKAISFSSKCNRLIFVQDFLFPSLIICAMYLCLFCTNRTIPVARVHEIS